jgi:hypothetical protein
VGVSYRPNPLHFIALDVVVPVIFFHVCRAAVFVRGGQQ